MQGCIMEPWLFSARNTYIVYSQQPVVDGTAHIYANRVIATNERKEIKLCLLKYSNRL
jgi:hypothetical protein